MLPDGKMCPLVTRPSSKSGPKTLPVVIIGKPSPASPAVFSCAVVALDLLSLTSVPVPHVLTQTRNPDYCFCILSQTAKLPIKLKERPLRVVRRNKIFYNTYLFLMVKLVTF